ncbi:MAG: hypothetical protein AAF959_30095 [Cyanobacteria bacterium P01_D01_bin.56]
MTKDSFNFLDLLNDEAWFQESVRLEEEIDCHAIAGSEWGAYLGDFMANPQGHRHFAHLHSMVIQAWNQYIAEWELGIGSEAAAVRGQELLLTRLEHPQVEVQEKLMALLEAKLSVPQGDWVMTAAIHGELRVIFGQLLTKDDWSEIAKSASNRTYDYVLEHQPLVLEKP